MEEIQSDWNQELRANLQELDRRGLDARSEGQDFTWPEDLPPRPPNPYLHHWVEAALRSMLMVTAKQGLDGLGWLPGKLQTERFRSADPDGLRYFYDVIVKRAMQALAKPWNKELVASDISCGNQGQHFREDISALFMDHSMRRDIRENGLPRMGAIRRGI